MKHLVAFVVLSALAALPASAYPGPTKVVNYTAAGMKGKTVSGYCWTSSIASPRSDAYRCMIGNTIMDPCFKISAKVVNCPQNLVTNTGTIIGLTKPLPASNPKTAAKPWTFQVNGPTACFAGTGTVVGNYPFYCQHDLVCAVPVTSAKFPQTYMSQCGTPNGPMSVKAPRAMFVTTLWQ